jgi:2-C-methyl-D-erythritol 2,4-cyclodiphosphate synthase
MDQRVGLGEDRHRLGEPGSGPLRIGGVDVPHDRGLIGHSDADVLLHAVTDALLGAAGPGDIGELFPNTDAANAGRDSADFLRHAAALVRDAGWQIVNLDCVVSAERPKIAPHKDAIRRSIAAILGIEPLCVGLKAKTGEGVGCVGRQEAIDARCVVLLQAR